MDANPITGSLPDGYIGMYALPLAQGDALVLAASDQGRALVETSFRWRSGHTRMERASDLLETRSGPGVSLLGDGDVLVTGGLDPDGVARASVEILSMERQAAELVGSLNEARAIHSSTLLPDGRVLVVGGLDAIADELSTVASAELWDRTTGQFTVVGSLDEPRYGHTATALPDGRVAIIGGVTITDEGIRLAETIETWSPDDGEFTAVGRYPRHAVNHTATLLEDGRVLVVGGITAAGAEVSDVVETWDPGSGAVTPAGTLSGPRAQHVSTLLDDGSVLVVGGQDLEGPVAATETWNDDAGMVGGPIDLRWPRTTPAVAVLSDGRILIVGGFGVGDYLSTYEVWSLALGGGGPKGQGLDDDPTGLTLDRSPMDGMGDHDAQG